MQNFVPCHVSRSLSERRAQLPNVTEEGRIPIFDIAYVGPVIVASFYRNTQESPIYFSTYGQQTAYTCRGGDFENPRKTDFPFKYRLSPSSIDTVSASETMKESMGC